VVFVSRFQLESLPRSDIGPASTPGASSEAISVLPATHRTVGGHLVDAGASNVIAARRTMAASASPSRRHEGWRGLTGLVS
jgi:hypothetical protein